jgi:hypothetical protein
MRTLDAALSVRHHVMMTFEAIEREACSLPSVERRRLIAHLVALQVAEDDPGHAEKMAAKIDCTDPSRWKTIEEVEAELGLGDGES